MKENVLVVRIAGSSGEGAISAGDTLALATARCGLNINTHKIYPAEVRGQGNTMYQICMSADKIYTAGESCDVFVALNAEVLELYSGDVKPGGYILYDDNEESKSVALNLPASINKIAVPFTEVTKEIKAPKSKNIFALGVFAGVLPQVDYTSQLKKDLNKKFGSKGEEVLNSITMALEEGIKYSKENLKHVDLSKYHLPASPNGKLVMTGNEAVGFGAVVAGCRFYAGYPITPATDIMEWLATEMPKVGGCVIQAEDEIAAVVMTIGASFNGAKSVTATSGPGLSLMSEAIGLASMSEVPIVIVDVQRGGPSTGLPTKPEQSDLSQAIFGTHGDTPKIVLAAINVEDCFYQTINAFNLAEKYQLPVILLSDASIGQRRESVNPIDLSKIEIFNRDGYVKIDKSVPYLRYGITPTGVSPMSIPGNEGGRYIATGLEHNELCAPNYNPKVHAAMTEKRFRKLEYAKKDFHKYKKFGPDDAKLGIVTWGSSTLAVLEAAQMAEKSGYKVQVMYPKIIHPIPQEWIDEFIENKDTILFIERNYVGQLANVIIQKFAGRKCINIKHFNKYDSENFYPTEIYNKIKEIFEGE